MANKTINCDLGECLNNSPDSVIMPLIDRANIACGGHAGNDNSMIQSIKLALKHHVIIGAHPSYADKANFGRISHCLNDNDLFDLIYAQISHFKKLCTQYNATLEYIKPHGALYHDMSNKPSVFKTICKVIEAVDINLNLMVPANFQGKTSIILLREVFADRLYKNGKMLARKEKGAVLNDSKSIIKQYQQFLIKKDDFDIDTICFHGDNPDSVEALKQL